MDRKNTWRDRAEKVINRVNTAFPNPEFENWSLCQDCCQVTLLTHGEKHANH